MYVRFGRVKPGKYSTYEYARYLMFMSEQLIRNDKNPFLSEQNTIFDFDNAGLANVDFDMIRTIANIL